MPYWRGVMLDQRSCDMMEEVAKICSPIPVTPTQGSYSGGVGASAGTHDGGGAIDIAASGLTDEESYAIELAMRCVGWAAWYRTPDQGNWPYHLHGIAVACPDLAPAASNQVDDYLAGRNGLADNGPDTGPRDFHYVGITWEEYLETVYAEKEEEEEEEMTKPWAVNAGDRGWVLTDLATYWCGVGNIAVIDEGVMFGAYNKFVDGAVVGPGWVDFIWRLRRVDQV